MTTRNPIVLVNGQLAELPAGDTINGATGGAPLSTLDGGSPTTPAPGVSTFKIDFGGVT